MPRNGRRKELIVLGLVQATGETRRNPKSGVLNATWGLSA